MYEPAKTVLKGLKKNSSQQKKTRPIVPLLKVESICGSLQAHTYVAFFKHLQTLFEQVQVLEGTCTHVQFPCRLLCQCCRCCDCFNEKWKRLIAESTWVNPVCLHVGIPQTHVRHLICKEIIFWELFGRAGIPGFNFKLWKMDWIKALITFAEGWR